MDFHPLKASPLLSGRTNRLSLRQRHFHTGRPVFQYGWTLRRSGWRYPVRQNLSQLRDAIGDALDQGDQEFAGYLAAALLAQSFWLGRPMAEIDALAQSIIPGIRSQLAPATLCQAVQQICLNLMGRSGDVYLLAGESGYDERIVVPAARLEGDVVALSVAATMKLGLYFWCGDYAGAVTVADEAIEHISGMDGNPVMQLVHLTSAMSRIHAAPKDRTTRRAVRTAIALHRKWAKDAPANYAAPCALIEGTWARQTLGTSPSGGKSNLRLHTQLFSGYGDSMIDFNRKRTVFSLGLSLVDF